MDTSLPILIMQIRTRKSDKEKDFMQYRRAITSGVSYFFTVNLADRKQSFLVDYIEQLRMSVGKVKQTHAFRIDAMVILSDHIHAIWTLLEFDSAYSK